MNVLKTLCVKFVIFVLFIVYKLEHVHSLVRSSIFVTVCPVFLSSGTLLNYFTWFDPCLYDLYCNFDTLCHRKMSISILYPRIFIPKYIHSAFKMLSCCLELLTEYCYKLFVYQGTVVPLLCKFCIQFSPHAYNCTESWFCNNICKFNLWSDWRHDFWSRWHMQKTKSCNDWVVYRLQKNGHHTVDGVSIHRIVFFLFFLTRN